MSVCLQWISLIVNVLLLGAACWALHLWKKQLRGTTEHEVARKLLGHVFRFRDGIRHNRQQLRSPWKKMPKLYHKWTEQQVSIVKRRRQRSCEHMENVLEKMGGSVCEAEVLWGDDIVELSTNLTWVADHFLYALDDLADCLDSKTQAEEKVLNTCFKPEGNDEFGDRLRSLVKEFQDYLQPYIKVQKSSKKKKKCSEGKSIS